MLLDVANPVDDPLRPSTKYEMQVSLLSQCPNSWPLMLLGTVKLESNLHQTGLPHPAPLLCHHQDCGRQQHDSTATPVLSEPCSYRGLLLYWNILMDQYSNRTLQDQYTSRTIGPIHRQDFIGPIHQQTSIGQIHQLDSNGPVGPTYRLRQDSIGPQVYWTIILYRQDPLLEFLLGW